MQSRSQDGFEEVSVDDEAKHLSHTTNGDRKVGTTIQPATDFHVKKSLDSGKPDTTETVVELSGITESKPGLDNAAGAV